MKLKKTVISGNTYRIKSVIQIYFGSSVAENVTSFSSEVRT